MISERGSGSDKAVALVVCGKQCLDKVEYIRAGSGHAEFAATGPLALQTRRPTLQL